MEDLPTTGGRSGDDVASGDFAEEGGLHKLKNLSTLFSMTVMLGEDNGTMEGKLAAVNIRMYWSQYPQRQVPASLLL